MSGWMSANSFFPDDYWLNGRNVLVPSYSQFEFEEQKLKIILFGRWHTKLSHGETND